MDELQDFKRYKIGQAAELLGIKPYVLRFWEGEFDQLEPIRTRSGQRLYTDEHIEMVRRIKGLLYDEGLTLEGAKRRLEEGTAAPAPSTPAPAPAAASASSDVLREIRDELAELLRMLS